MNHIIDDIHHIFFKTDVGFNHPEVDYLDITWEAYVHNRLKATLFVQEYLLSEGTCGMCATHHSH
jgi:hypothetical protein